LSYESSGPVKKKVALNIDRIKKQLLEDSDSEEDLRRVKKDNRNDHDTGLNAMSGKSPSQPKKPLPFNFESNK